MLLGILLHATVAYKVHPLPTWPDDPNNQSWFFDYLYFVVHSFRMPLFFLIAGYFCRFLYHRIGEKAFIIHRAKRILVPFIFSMILILPLTIFPFLLYRYSGEGNWNEIFRKAFDQLLGWNGMAHLWFLYFLLIYYCIIILLFRLRRSFGRGSLMNAIGKKINTIRFNNITTVLLASIPPGLILLLVPELYLHVDTGIIPKFPYLAFFGYFFLIGWLINRSASAAFSWITGKTGLFLVTGMGISILLFWLEFSGWYANADFIGKTGAKMGASLQAILLVFGSIGFFLRFWQSESRLWKYVSDASYWMYLIHLAIVAGFQVFLIGYPIGSAWKFLLIMLATLAITLVTYHYLIRYSVVGEWMHGRRKKPGG